jgi:uncharacterized BrkB/YihY/UPF0761 family membrane protein
MMAANLRAFLLSRKKRWRLAVLHGMRPAGRREISRLRGREQGLVPWGDERYNWWQLPVRGLLMLETTGAAGVIGLLAPVVASLGRAWLAPRSGSSSWVYTFWGFVVPLLVICSSLALFYRFAPRRPTTFRQVLPATLCATALFQLTERLFIAYLQSFSKLNALYGAFGGAMALLLWIYAVGYILIFGACLCAAGVQSRG